MGVLTDIGGEVVVVSTTSNAAAGTITSAAVNRLGLFSAVLAHSVGAATGTPDSFTVATKLTECDTTGGTYTDATGFTVTTRTADSTVAQADFNLSTLKQFIKVVTIVAFVNGTSPKIAVNQTLVYGGSDHGPVA